jgi:hypothetical protein
MKFFEIPNSWIIALLTICLVVMRCFGIDSFTTAGLGLIIGYVTGKHVEQTRCVQKA